MSAAVQALRLGAGVELGYTLVDRLARDLGIRLLAIKGPVLQLQGLRGPRQSADVDAWVDPRELGRAVAALTELGWVAGGSYFGPAIIPRHSVTLHHPRWPCEIDLHHYFPGFLAPAQDVFEVLWARRAAVVLAGQGVTCVDRVAHAAVAGLHYLRQSNDPLRITDLRELTALIVRDWSTPDLADLADLAGMTGSDRTLLPLLTAVQAPVSAPDGAREPEGLDDWRLVTQARSPTTVWLVAFLRTPWHRRPLFVLRAFFSTRRRPERLGRLAELTARVRRLGNDVLALRTLPLALRELRRLGGGRR